MKNTINCLNKKKTLKILFTYIVLLAYVGDTVKFVGDTVKFVGDRP